MDVDGGASWARTKVPSIDRSNDDLERETERSLEGELQLEGADAASQGRGDTNKEIFCFGDANLGEAM